MQKKSQKELIAENGIIITHEKDWGIIEESISSGVPLIVHQYFLYDVLRSKLSNLNSEYFYWDADGEHAEADSIKDTGKNWFRDENGKDTRRIGGLSIPLIINQRVLSTFANFYREYKSLKQLSEKYKRLHVSVNVSPYFKMAAEYFPNLVEYFDPGHVETYKENSCPELSYIPVYPNPHKFSIPARIIQRLFSPFIKKEKNIMLADWTTGFLKERSDLLTQNNLNVFRGYYFRKKVIWEKEAKEVFPEALPESFITCEIVKDYHKRNNYSWEDNLVEGYVRIFKEIYATYRANLFHSYVMYRDLFRKYEPRLVSLPGEALHAYVIAFQLAKKMGITTLLLVDGYQIIWSPNLIYFNEDNSQPEIDYVGGFGPAGVDMMKISGFKDEQIKLIKPPLLHYMEKVVRSPKSDSMLVMYPYPKNQNPNCRWDKRRTNVIDVVELCKRMGFTKVAIKMKPGMPGETTEDEAYFRKKYNDGSVVIESGPLYNCLGFYESMVTPLSTAVAEALYFDVKCYLYEPFDDGITDEDIDNTLIAERKHFARTLEALESNIKSKNYVIADKEYLFSGPELMDFNFNLLR